MAGEEAYFFVTDPASALLLDDNKKCVCRCDDQEVHCYVKTKSTSVAFRRDASQEAWVGVVSPRDPPCAVFISLVDGSVIEGDTANIKPVNLSKTVNKPIDLVRVCLEEARGYVSFQYCGYHVRQELPKSNSKWSFAARLCCFGASVSVGAAQPSKDVKNSRRNKPVLPRSITPSRMMEMKDEIPRTPEDNRIKKLLKSQEAEELPRTPEMAQAVNSHSPVSSNGPGTPEVEEKPDRKSRNLKSELSNVKTELSRPQIRTRIAPVKGENSDGKVAIDVEKLKPPRIELFEHQVFRGLRCARKNSQDELDAKDRIAAHMKLVFREFNKDVSLDQMQFAFINGFLQEEHAVRRGDVFSAFSELCALLSKHGHKGRVVQIAYKFLTAIKEKRRHHFTWKEAVKYKSFCEEPDDSEPCGLWSAADCYTTAAEVGKRNRWRAFLRQWGEEVALKLDQGDPEDLEADPSSESSSVDECPQPAGYPVGTAPRQKKRKKRASISESLVASLRRPHSRERTPRRRPVDVGIDEEIPETTASTTPRTPPRGSPAVKKEALERESASNSCAGASAEQQVPEPAALQAVKQSPEKLRAMRTSLQQVKQEIAPVDQARTADQTMYPGVSLGSHDMSSSDWSQEHVDVPMENTDQNLSPGIPSTTHHTSSPSRSQDHIDFKKEYTAEHTTWHGVSSKSLGVSPSDWSNEHVQFSEAHATDQSMWYGVSSGSHDIASPDWSKAYVDLPKPHTTDQTIWHGVSSASQDTSSLDWPQAKNTDQSMWNGVSSASHNTLPPLWSSDWSQEDSIPESFPSWNLPIKEVSAKAENVDTLQERLPSFTVPQEFPSFAWPHKQEPQPQVSDSSASTLASALRSLPPLPVFPGMAPPPVMQANAVLEQVPGFTASDWSLPSTAAPENQDIQNPQEPIFSTETAVPAQQMRTREEVAPESTATNETNNAEEDWASVMDMLQGLQGESSREEEQPTEETLREEKQQEASQTLNWQTWQEGEWKSASRTVPQSQRLVVEPIEEPSPWWEDSSMAEPASWWPEAKRSDAQSARSQHPQATKAASHQDLGARVATLEKTVQALEEELEAGARQYEPTESPDTDAASDTAASETTEFIESDHEDTSGPPQASVQEPPESAEAEPRSIEKSEGSTSIDMLRTRWQKLSQLWEDQVHEKPVAHTVADSDLDRRLQYLIQS